MEVSPGIWVDAQRLGFALSALACDDTKVECLLHNRFDAPPPFPARPIAPGNCIRNPQRCSIGEALTGLTALEGEARCRGRWARLCPVAGNLNPAKAARPRK